MHDDEDEWNSTALTDHGQMQRASDAGRQMTTRTDRPNAEWSSCMLGARRGDSGGGGACTIRRRREGITSVVVVTLVAAWHKTLCYQ